MGSNVRRLENAVSLLVDGFLREEDSDEMVRKAVATLVRTASDWAENLPDGDPCRVAADIAHVAIFERATGTSRGPGHDPIDMARMVDDMQAELDEPDSLRRGVILSLLTRYRLLPV